MNDRIFQLLKKIESIEDGSDFIVLSSNTSMRLVGGLKAPNQTCGFNSGCSGNTGCQGNSGCSGNHECYNQNGSC